MGLFHESMNEYRKHLKNGAIQEAYRGLMKYFNSLRVFFMKKYPDHYVSGSVYHGYMDMTYFAFFPKSLKRRKLKVGIVFLHKEFRFEVWLFGVNKKVQSKYWKLFNESNWGKYNIALTPRSFDFIVSHVLIDDPDFGDLDALTEQIENGTLKFIEDIENFLNQLN